MQNDLPRQFAHSTRGLVIAPAGCGKTHLIAESVSHCEGRQLVLTHTHAGVRAILDHLKRQGVPSAKYRVTTIDGFALRYAHAFSSLSGWNDPQPRGDAWAQLRPAAVDALRRSAVKSVIRSSYAGLYVDEYQDCTRGQHQLILALAQVLPTRVVGDPLQSVFWKLNSREQFDWRTILDHYTLIDEISTPHRWRDRNQQLGEWLMEVRRILLEGRPLDLRGAPISWETDVGRQNQLAVCRTMLRHSEHSLLALREWGNQCHDLARSLNGAFHGMETVECKHLHEWAQRIETTTGTARVCEILGFAALCLARLPTALKGWAVAFGAGRTPSARLPQYLTAIHALTSVIENDDVSLIDRAMDALEHVDSRVLVARRELWREMRRSLRECHRAGGSSIADTAWHVRNRSRLIGRRVERRCLSTTLLVKGLQFDHVAILNAVELADAENLYVALTRGSRSLTLLSASSILQRARPYFTAVKGN